MSAPARKETTTAATPPIIATNTKTAAKLRRPTKAPTTVNSFTSPAPPAPTAKSRNSARKPPSAPSKPCQIPSPYTVWASKPTGRAGSVSQFGMRRDWRSVKAAISTTTVNVTRMGRGSIHVTWRAAWRSHRDRAASSPAPRAREPANSHWAAGRE